MWQLLTSVQLFFRCCELKRPPASINTPSNQDAARHHVLIHLSVWKHEKTSCLVLSNSSKPWDSVFNHVTQKSIKSCFCTFFFFFTSFCKVFAEFCWYFVIFSTQNFEEFVAEFYFILFFFTDFLVNFRHYFAKFGEFWALFDFLLNSWGFRIFSINETIVVRQQPELWCCCSY